MYPSSQAQYVLTYSVCWKFPGILCVKPWWRTTTPTALVPVTSAVTQAWKVINIGRHFYSFLTGSSPLHIKLQTNSLRLKALAGEWHHQPSPSPSPSCPLKTQACLAACRATNANTDRKLWSFNLQRLFRRDVRMSNISQILFMLTRSVPRCCSAIDAETTGCRCLATRLSRHDGPTALEHLTGSNNTDMCLQLIISKEVKQRQNLFSSSLF